ncbi:hypothetical protein HELRODRAFT_64369, partial [Helobdella robusta]|uniref:Apple domain-containing protein n=1 Tax=Helobdella robusta TaxID=6412 RepID=T1FXT7_HELRO
ETFIFQREGCWYKYSGLKLPDSQLEVITEVTGVAECKRFCESYDVGPVCYVLQVVSNVCYRNKEAVVDWSDKMEDQPDSMQYQLASCPFNHLNN